MKMLVNQVGSADLNVSTWRWVDCVFREGSVSGKEETEWVPRSTDPRRNEGKGAGDLRRIGDQEKTGDRGKIDESKVEETMAKRSRTTA